MQNVLWDFDKLHHSYCFELFIHLSVIYRNVSVVKTIQKWNIYTKHHFSVEKSWKSTKLVWNIALENCKSEFYFSYRHIMRNVWYRNFPVPYETVFIVQNGVTWYRKYKLWCKHTVPSAIMGMVPGTYVECSGCAPQSYFRRLLFRKPSQESGTSIEKHISVVARRTSIIWWSIAEQPWIAYLELFGVMICDNSDLKLFPYYMTRYVFKNWALLCKKMEAPFLTKNGSYDTGKLLFLPET